MIFLHQLNPSKTFIEGDNIGCENYFRCASTRLWARHLTYLPSSNKSNKKKTGSKYKLPDTLKSRLKSRRMLKVCLVITVVGITTYSLPASAGVFDPIIRVLLPSKEHKKADYRANTNQSSGSATEEQSKIDNRTEPQVTPDQTIVRKRPSLMNVMHAEFLANRGDIDKALSIYKVEAFKNDAASVFERALSLSLLYEPVEDSLSFAKSWQQQNPEHIPAQFYVAHLALKAYDYSLAGNILTQILEYDPQADLSEILIGIYPTNAADKRKLLETLQALPDHENSSIQVMEAGLMSQLGQPEKAYVSISKALKAQPNNAPYITLKADIIKQLQPYPEVLSYIEKERKRFVNNKTLYLYEIRYRLSLGQNKEAWALLLEAHDLFQDDEITLLAALVSIDIEAYEKADELLSGLASSPYYLDRAYYYLGISAERQGNFDKAERFLSKVMQENLVLESRKKLVAIQLLQNEPERALDTLKLFSEQFDVYAPDSAIMQADILRQQNKIDDALRILADTNLRFPDDTKLLFARAQLLDNDKDATLKRNLLNRLILLNPENPDYKITLAVLLFESDNQQDIDKSLEIAQSILDLPFDSAFYSQDNYLMALNLIAADALSKQRYQAVVNYLEVPYQVSPTLDTGIILLRAYQGLERDNEVSKLLTDLQNRFGLGQKDISDRLQAY